MKKWTLMLGAGMLGCCAVFAADPVKTPAAADLKIAQDLLVTMGIPEQLEMGLKAQTDAMRKASPQGAVLAPILEKFQRKYVSFDVLKEDLAKIYARHLTPTEMQELITLYRNPALQKFIKTTSAKISAETGELSRRRVQEHQLELMQMIQQAMAAQQKAAAPTAPAK